MGSDRSGPIADQKRRRRSAAAKQEAQNKENGDHVLVIGAGEALDCHAAGVPRPGRLTTREFTLAGSDLYVNVVVGLHGELRVEAVDDTGKVRAYTAPVTLDQTGGKVAWESGSLDALKGSVVSLRFTLRNASLYSYWLDEKQ